MMPNTTTAAGDRLILNEIVPEYFAFTLEWLRSETLRRELVIQNPPQSKTEQEAWYNDYINNPSKLIYIAVLESTKQPIGQIGFNHINRRHQHGEMHVFLGEKKYYGQGYAQEMMKLFLDIAFNRLHLNKVWLKVNDDNIRAIKFYQKMGFVREGLLARHEYYQGRFLNKIVFSRFASEKK